MTQLMQASRQWLLNYGLIRRDVEEVGVIRRELDDNNAPMSYDFRAATGPDYGRIWDAEIIVPGEFGKAITVTRKTQRSTHPTAIALCSSPIASRYQIAATASLVAWRVVSSSGIAKSATSHSASRHSCLTTPAKIALCGARRRSSRCEGSAGVTHRRC